MRVCRRREAFVRGARIREILEVGRAISYESKTWRGEHGISHRHIYVVKTFGTFGGMDMSKAWVGVLWMSAALAAPGHAGGSRAPGLAGINSARPLQQRGADVGVTNMPTITEKTAGMQKLRGYFNLYWDAKQGKLWLEIDKWGSAFLYQRDRKS